jgi:hypothetical protein
MGWSFAFRFSSVAVRTAVAALACLACSSSPVPPGGSSSAGQDASGQGGALGAASGSGGTAGLGAAGGSGGVATAGDTGFEGSVQPFIDKACNCHQSTPVLMAPFSLKRGEAYSNLVNAPSIQLPSMMRVKPGAISASYLWHKIDGTQLQVGGSGMIMPYTFPLNPDERAIFERWITAGALP